MWRIYVKRHNRLATVAKLKSASGRKEPNDHEMSKVTTTIKGVLRAYCDLLSEK